MDPALSTTVDADKKLVPSGLFAYFSCKDTSLFLNVDTLDLDPEISRWEFLYGDNWDKFRDDYQDSWDSESVPSLIPFASDESDSLDLDGLSDLDDQEPDPPSLPSQPPFRILPDDDTFKANNFVGFMPIPRHASASIRPRAFIPVEKCVKPVSVSKSLKICFP